MPPQEITDEDRAIIDKYISLLYADAFIESDLEKPDTSITKAIIGVVKQGADAAMLDVRRKLRDRGIIVNNTAKGVFSCKVRGYDHQVVLNGEMAKAKAQKVLHDMMPEE
jgi:hypothetical protein